MFLDQVTECGFAWNKIQNRKCCSNFAEIKYCSRLVRRAVMTGKTERQLVRIVRCVMKNSSLNICKMLLLKELTGLVELKAWIRNVFVWFSKDSEQNLTDCLINFDSWLTSSKVLTAWTLSMAMDDNGVQKKQVDGERKEEQCLMRSGNKI